jgi:rhamnogalacturonyl hydrolase YesR
MLGKSKMIVFMLLLMVVVSLGAQDDSENRPIVDTNILENRSLEDLIKVVTYRQITEQKDGEYIKGDWDDVKISKRPQIEKMDYTLGVTMYGMQLAYGLLKDDKIVDYVNDFNHYTANYYQYLRWQKNRFGTVYTSRPIFKLWRLNMLDDCGAVGTSVLEAVLRHNCELTPQLKEMIDIIGNYVTKVQPRLPDGTFWRPKFQKVPRIWADDLYMSIPFMVRWSEYTKDDSVLSDAAQQIINFAKYLQDEEDGVWFHGYFVKKKERSLYKWGRANGWVAVATVEVLSVLPKDHPKYPQVLDIFKKQIAGLKKYQDTDGLWHQVLDHPEQSFGTETSCSAQFVYAIARGIRRGWLDKSNTTVVEKAIKGLKLRISEEGGLYKVCKGTGIGENIEYYNNRATPYDDTHGKGLMLFALTEAYYLFGDK